MSTMSPHSDQAEPPPPPLIISVIPIRILPFLEVGGEEALYYSLHFISAIISQDSGSLPVRLNGSQTREKKVPVRITFIIIIIMPVIKCQSHPRFGWKGEHLPDLLPFGFPSPPSRRHHHHRRRHPPPLIHPLQLSSLPGHHLRQRRQLINR